MPFTFKIMANMENYIVFDKSEIWINIRLKEEYMIMVWSYSLIAYKSKIFARQMLYHWFTGDIIQYWLFFNLLFLITSAQIIKFVYLIILNPNKNSQNKALWKIQKEVNYLLPIESTLEQTILSFKNILPQILDIPKFFPN